MSFTPKLDSLPAPQRALWRDLASVPATFTLYGGTALGLRLGHRTSIDFDFFSNQAFDPDQLSSAVPWLRDAERLQVSLNTLTCRVDRGGPVLLSFFGDLGLGQVEPPELTDDRVLRVASLLDLAGTKAAVIQKRAEVKDYIDVDALLRQPGIGMKAVLAAAKAVYGRRFNPLITLKALSYFDDVPALPADVRTRLTKAVSGVGDHYPA